MKTKTFTRRELTHCLTAATASLLLCTAIFCAMADTAMASSLEQPQKIPTQYPAAVSVSHTGSTATNQTSSFNYSVADNDIYTAKPTAQSIGRDNAAGIGAKMIEDIYGANLEGATIEMGYCAPTDTLPRASWVGDISIKNSSAKYADYYFVIDALTGERFTASQGATLDVSVDLGLDMELQKNPSAYVQLAVTTAKQMGIISGEVESAVYNGQGYVNDNNPSISIDVHGDNNQKALLSFSRYNQELLGVCYPTYTAINDLATERLIESLNAEIDRQHANSSEAGSGLITLK